MVTLLIMLALCLLVGGVSMRPSTFVEGGLLDDVDVSVKEAAFLMYNYDGSGPNTPTLGLTLVHMDGDEEKESQQYFSCGKAEYFMPSADDKTPADMGDFLIPVSDKTAVNTNSNLAKFLASLVNAGYPEDKLDAFKASDLVGLQFHLKREPVKRSGLVRTGKNAQREQSVVTVAKINKLPWEGTAAAPKAGLGAAAAKASGSKAPAAATSLSKSNGKAAAGPSAEVAAKALETIQAVLIENGGSLPKGKMATAVFGALKGDADQKEISQLVFKDDFLKGLEGIAFDGAKVEMA